MSRTRHESQAYWTANRRIGVIFGGQSAAFAAVLEFIMLCNATGDCTPAYLVVPVLLACLGGFIGGVITVISGLMSEWPWDH